MDSTSGQINLCRQTIRYHRGQKGDDRCWVDDISIWKLLPDAPPEPTALPPFNEMMQRCGAFYRYRRADKPDPTPPQAMMDTREWDKDLASMTETDLQQELERIYTAIRKHRDIQGRERTLDDDRALYLVLPEQLTADFRLPPEPDFLGEARAPKAGCPSFWRSHQNCNSDKHDIHSWGPCGNMKI